MSKVDPYTIAKAKQVQELINQHYEAGRNDKCYSWIYRNKVKPIYPMSERTFNRYLKMIKDLKLTE